MAVKSLDAGMKRESPKERRTGPKEGRKGKVLARAKS